jgi:hypothetical protein
MVTVIVGDDVEVSWQILRLALCCKAHTRIFKIMSYVVPIGLNAKKKYENR